MVNLGVTFRNSKWSSYGRKNISLQFVHKYLRNLTVFAFVVLLTFFFNPTNLLDNVWGALDTTLSNFLFGYFFLLAALHTVVNNLYTTLLSKLMGGANPIITQKGSTPKSPRPTRFSPTIPTRSSKGLFFGLPGALSQDHWPLPMTPSSLKSFVPSTKGIIMKTRLPCQPLTQRTW